MAQGRSASIPKDDENIHGPLIGKLLGDMKFEDMSFLSRLRKGFQVAGHLDKSVVGMVPETKVWFQISLQAFWEGRRDCNAVALRQMRSTEFYKDLTVLAKEGAEMGCMIDLVQVSPESIKDVFISRRVVAREFKLVVGRDRIRPVDRGSESFLKVAPWSDEKTQVQGLEFLTTMAIHCYMYNLVRRQWKRDLKFAFPSCPFDQHHVWCSRSAWKVENQVWMSRHLASPYVVLGHWVGTDDGLQAAVPRVDQDKTARWKNDLFGILVTGPCSSAMASKFAGRFSWVCTSQADKIG